MADAADAKEKEEQQVRFLGFSGPLMIFSNSRLIIEKDKQEPKEAPRPQR